MNNGSAMKEIYGRSTAALLNPRPVVLVTCCDSRGRPNVFSVAWQTPLSHEPPMVGISVDNRRYSYRIIKDTGQFAINILDRSFQDAVEVCGNYSGEHVDKFSAAKLSVKPARRIKPPLIEGALAHLECVVESVLKAGDHTFFAAVVCCAEVHQTGFSDAWTTDIGKVLLCLQRDRFVTWAELCE